jgi:hypothetical protein
MEYPCILAIAVGPDALIFRAGNAPFDATSHEIFTTFLRRDDENIHRL